MSAAILAFAAHAIISVPVLATRAVVIYEMVAIKSKVIRLPLLNVDQVLGTGGGGRDVLRSPHKVKPTDSAQQEQPLG